MAPEVFLLAALLVAFVAACAFEWVSTGLAAVGLLGLLAVTGLVAPHEAFEGFASPAVVTIAGLYVLNAGIQKSGLLAWLGGRLAHVASKRPRGALVLLLGVTGALSLFISNVAATALLLPAVLAACRKAELSPSRYLMPVAFVSLAGGMGTLAGATANVIVDGEMARAGMEPFGFFEYGKVGLPFLGAAFVYLAFAGSRWIPERRPVELAEETLRGYLVEVIVPDGSKLAGGTIGEARLGERFGLALLAVRRGDRRIVAPTAGERLEAGDRLVVEAGAEDVAAVIASKDLDTVHDAKVAEHDIESEGIGVFEALVAPRSRWAGGTARGLRLRSVFGLTVLAVLRGGAAIRKRPQDVKVQVGDELLLQGPEAAVREAAARGDVLLLSRLEPPALDLRRAALPAAVLAGVIAIAATGIVPLSVAAWIGAVALVAARVLDFEEAVGAVDLHVLVVVACVLPFGHALERSGAGRLLEGGLHALSVWGGAWAVLAALYGATVLLTQVVQKAAVAIAFPLALSAAEAAGASPAPFLMAVAMAGSSAFLTPLGHPVNLIIAAPGRYRFGDFARVGWPLQLLAAAAALVLIPWFWPLGPA